MKIRVYSAYSFIIPYLEKANKEKHELFFCRESLSLKTVHLARGYSGISIFSSDNASAAVLEKLASFGVRYISLRSTGFDYINLDAAKKLKIRVANVPEYAPDAIAEHAMALLLAVNRKLIKSHHRIQRYNFTISGLTGFNLSGKTIGIIGTGNIGSVMAKICKGFGCKLLGYDLHKNLPLIKQTGIVYTSLVDLCKKSDVITLHVPLNKETHHLINKEMIANMKPGVILINTARGAVVDTLAVLEGLNSNKIAALGTDVYEFEKGYFFENHSGHELKDKVLKTLIAKPNVLITAHHAFLTKEALTNIAQATIKAFDFWESGKNALNELYELTRENSMNPLKQ